MSLFQGDIADLASHKLWAEHGARVFPFLPVRSKLLLLLAVRPIFTRTVTRSEVRKRIQAESRNAIKSQQYTYNSITKKWLKVADSVASKAIIIELCRKNGLDVLGLAHGR